jgi:hypothetical protein
MPIQLEDGKGSGKVAEVDSNHRLRTKSIIETEQESISEDDGLAFSWASGTYDPDAGDTILLVKNTSATKTLRISKIWVSSDTETRVVVHCPTADVTVAGTTITGANLNRTSSNVAEATAARDETGNSQGDILWSGEVQATSGVQLIEFSGSVILGTNDSIGVDFVSATTAGDVVVFGHYRDK